MFTLTVFETLLFENRLVLRPVQWVTVNARVKKMFIYLPYLTFLNNLCTGNKICFLKKYSQNVNEVLGKAIAHNNV